MRWTEALQGVRMIEFPDILGRYEALAFIPPDAMFGDRVDFCARPLQEIPEPVSMGPKGRSK